jgi:hypothetical protein
MGTSGYEIRHALLSEAKDMLYEQWHAARDSEMQTASLENRPPKHLPAPSIDDIKAAAESLYEFVQKKG